MKNNKKGVSIVEALVSMVIIVIGIIGTYEIYLNALYLSDSAKNKIKAIEMAREGIEVVINIRNTNWIKFGADYKNCWNTLNYNNSCLNSTLTGTDIQPGSYIIWRDNNYKWNLTKQTTGGSDNYGNTNYNNNYKINIDTDGFYTQSGGTTLTGALFTREIIISYLEDTNSDSVKNSNDEKMNIDSLVIWADRASNQPHKIRLNTIISGWRK